MISTSYNDYYKWYYDDQLFARKPRPNAELAVKYDTQVSTFGTFQQELVNNAHRIIDQYPGKKFSILLSGGSESETMIRVYRQANIDFTAYIFRYENDYNLYDVSYAVSAAESIGANYKVIDFNLRNFFETDAEKLSEIAQVDRPRALPQIKFIDYITDNSVILGGQGDTAWSRSDDDYNKPGRWYDIYSEFEIGWDRYVKEINREVIMCWFRFTPELVLAHNSTEWARKLRTDQFYGKLGVRSTKLQGYKEVFPEMLERRKKNGMELVDDLINEFERYLSIKYNGLPYRGRTQKTWQQICTELLGHTVHYS